MLGPFNVLTIPILLLVVAASLIRYGDTRGYDRHVREVLEATLETNRAIGRLNIDTQRTLATNDEARSQIVKEVLGDPAVMPDAPLVPVSATNSSVDRAAVTAKKTDVSCGLTAADIAKLNRIK